MPLGALLVLAVVVGSALHLSRGSRLSVDWVDEGQIVYPAWRVSEGALPYRDFRHLYGPSLFFVNAALFERFGVDLAVLRNLMVGLKAAMVGLVFLAARAVAPLPVALGLALLLAAVWGWPAAHLNTPYASYYGLPLALAGMLLPLALPRRPRAAWWLAGLAIGTAATFKQTNGLFPALALALLSLARSRPGADGAPPGALQARAAAVLRGAAFVACVALPVYYLRGSTLGNAALLAGPWLLCCAAVGLREWRTPPDPRERAASATELLGLAAGLVVAPAAYALFYAGQGALPALVADTVTEMPALIRWFVPLEAPGSLAVLWVACLLGAAGAGVSSRPPRLRAGVGGLSLGGLALASVAFLREEAFSGLVSGLFPLLPHVVTWLALATWLRGGARLGERELLVLLLAASGLLYLYPAADWAHAYTSLPVFLPALGLLLARPFAAGLARSRTIYLATLAVAVGLFLAVPFVLIQRDYAALRGRPLPQRASGIRVPGAMHRDHVALAAALLSDRHRERDVVVLSGQHLLYFVSGRVSPLEEHEFALYLNRFEGISGEDLRRLVDQDAVVARLEATRPLLVEDYQGAGARLRRQLPRLGRYIERRYREQSRVGGLRILDRREPAR